MTGPGHPDVVAAGERPRSRRGWWVVAAVVAAALTFSTLRAGDGGPEPSPSPTPTGWTEYGPPPGPAPALSAPPLAGRVSVTVAGERAVVRDGTTLLEAGDGRRVASFLPLRDGWAALVAEEPVVSSHAGRLHVSSGGRRRTLTVDPEARVFAAWRPGQFWVAERFFDTVRRYDARLTLLETRHVTGMWSAVGDTESGLLLEKPGGLATQRDAGSPVEELATGVDSFVATDGRRVLWRSGFCTVRCGLSVTGVRDRSTWEVPVPDEQVAYPSVALGPSGDAVAYVATTPAAFRVVVVRRGGEPETVVATPLGTEPRGSLHVDWVDGRRVAVFEARDDVATFVYDTATRALASAGRVEVFNPETFLAGPTG